MDEQELSKVKDILKENKHIFDKIVDEMFYHMAYLVNSIISQGVDISDHEDEILDLILKEIDKTTQGYLVLVRERLAKLKRGRRDDSN